MDGQVCDDVFRGQTHNFRAAQNDALMESVLAKAIKPGSAFELSPIPPIKQTIKCQPGYLKKKISTEMALIQTAKKGHGDISARVPLLGVSELSNAAIKTNENLLEKEPRL